MLMATILTCAATIGIGKYLKNSKISNPITIMISPFKSAEVLCLPPSEMLSVVLAKAAVTGSPPNNPAAILEYERAFISFLLLHLSPVFWSAILAEIRVSRIATKTIGSKNFQKSGSPSTSTL